MNSTVFKEPQYYPTYLCFLLCGSIAFKSKNTILQFILKFYAYFATASVLLLPIFDIYTMISNGARHEKFTEVLMGSLVHIPTCTKVVYFQIIRSRFEKLMYFLEYEILESENPKVLKKFQETKRASRRFAIVYVVSIMFASITYSIPPVISGLSNIFYYGELRTVTDLPFPIKIPYDTKTMNGYLLSTIQMFFQVTWISLFFIGYGILTASLMNSMAGHFKCLGIEFKSIIANREETKTNSVKEFKKCIKTLLKIHKAHYSLEEIQNVVFLLQYISAIMAVAVTLYITTMDTTLNLRLVKAAGFLFVVLFEPFLYCWFGDKVTREAENLRTHLWESNWVGSDMEYQRLITITMIQLWKPVVFTCGKIVFLNNSTFVTIINTAYSAFNLMKKTRKQNSN